MANERPLINNTNFNSATHWIDGDKNIWPISDLDTSHLNNILSFLRKQFPGKEDKEIAKVMHAFGPMLKESEIRKINELGKYKPSIFEAREW